MICTIIILLLLAVNLSIAAIKHGEIKENIRYDFPTELIATIITILLCWGAGLFDKF